MPANEWHEMPLPIPSLPIDAIKGIKATLETINEMLVGGLEAAKTGLEAVKVFLLAYIDPLVAVLEAFRQSIDDIISGLLDTGVYVSWVLPSLALPYSLEAELAMLGDSFLDLYDENRPIQADSADYFLMVYTGRAFKISELEQIIRLLIELFDIKDVFNFEDYVEENTEPDLLGGQTVRPDWATVRLLDLFPPLKDLVLELKSLLDLYAPKTDFSKFIDNIIELIEDKIDILTALQNTITAAIEKYEAILNAEPLDVLIIQGTGSAQDVRNEINLAIGTIPDPIENVGALFALMGVGPDVPNTLRELFGIPN